MKWRNFVFIVYLTLGACQIGMIEAADAILDEPDASGRAAWAKLSEMGSGFLVWESNRTGRWRLWRRELDGTGLRQISPEENGRDHYCPHLSPDGRRLVYLSYPAGVHTYESGIPKGPVQLFICDADGSHNRQLTDSARAYFEDRAAVWLNDAELVYIDHGGTTRKLQVDDGKNVALTSSAGGGNGWLINATLTFATTGLPTFSAYNVAKSEILPQGSLQGCQPYFTHNGDWGVWMGGAGGPINRINLKSRQVSPILSVNDPRMPKDRNYLYFPMISRCGRLFAFAASPGQHDHFTSDYDVFVAPINPDTLELAGNPVRYSFHRGNDRFPDVYLRGLEFGQSTGEAPYTAEFTPPSEGQWHYEFGDGQQGDGSKLKHIYAKEGRYTVVASQGTRTIRGLVAVEPAAPPKVLNARLTSPLDVTVEFDEPVEIQNLDARLNSGTAIKTSKLSSDRKSVVLTLGAKLTGADTLQLAGVSDRSSRPNVMPTQSINIRGSAWPSSALGLEYVYGTADQPNVIPGRAGEPSRSFGIQPRGRGRWNHDQALVLNGGSFIVDGANERLFTACRSSGQLTVEAVVRPDHAEQVGPARIVTFSSSAFSRNFTLAQEGPALVFRLRTPKTGDNGVNPETRIATLTTGEAQHIAVTYQPGQLTAYINGKEVHRSNSVRGDFSNWQPHHLVLGDEFDGNRNWAGTVEGIAIYSRALSSAEIAQNAEEYQRMLRSRLPVNQVHVKARLIAKSPVPTLDEVKPYRGAMMVSKYAVQQVLQGDLKDKEILVVQWALLDGQAQPIAALQPGAEVKLLLETADANHQLKRFVCKDRFDSDDELLVPRFYDASP